MNKGTGRLLFGLVVFSFSLLAVFRAPVYHLWILAILATEWGHRIAPFALLALYPGWSLTRRGRAGAALGVCAAALLLTPVLRARPVAAALPAALDRAFGPAPASAPPFAWSTLLLGSPKPDIVETTEEYSRGCGGPLRLQLYRPLAAKGRSPLVLVVHGGSWRSGDRRELAELSRRLAARGYAVASVDYELAPAATFPGPVDDVRAALAWLAVRANGFSIDMSRVVLLGRSAGAQIALAAAHQPEPLPGVRGVVDFYGPNDLFLAWRVPGPKRIIDSRLLLGQYLGGSPSEQPERYRLASPLLAAGKGSPPVLMIHGGRDELVWPLHEVRLSEKLEKAGVPHYYLAMPWATHGCDFNPDGPCGQLSAYAVERFLAFAFK